MTETEPSDDEPVFEVQHITGDRTMTALVPQFKPWELDDDHRHAYNALKEFGSPHYSGAIAVPRWAAGKFDTDGETATLEAASRRHAEAARETAETLKQGMCEFAGTLMPALASVAESMQPLVECVEECGIEEVRDDD